MLTFITSAFRKRQQPTANRSREAAATLQRSRAMYGPGSDQYWQHRRDPIRPQDQILSAMAKLWVESLPKSQRPLSLAQQYPRIANRLALCWCDPQLTGTVLHGLLIDKRGGRKGFPADVLVDLRNLRGMLGDPVNYEPEKYSWALHELASADR